MSKRKKKKNPEITLCGSVYWTDFGLENKRIKREHRKAKGLQYKISELLTTWMDGSDGRQ